MFAAIDGAKASTVLRRPAGCRRLATSFAPRSSTTSPDSPEAYDGRGAPAAIPAPGTIED
jgi:hypothetical protein